MNQQKTPRKCEIDRMKKGLKGNFLLMLNSSWVDEIKIHLKAFHNEIRLKIVLEFQTKRTKLKTVR